MAVNDNRARIDRLMSGSGSAGTATCERCGSTHFYSVNVEQFSKGFGSVEYQNISTNPKVVRICLCGLPLPVKSNVKGATAIRAMQEEFFTSLNGAREYISSNSAQAVVAQAASPKELEALKQDLLIQIEELSKKMQTFIPKETPKVKDKV